AAYELDRRSLVDRQEGGGCGDRGDGGGCRHEGGHGQAGVCALVSRVPADSFSTAWTSPIRTAPTPPESAVRAACNLADMPPFATPDEMIVSISSEESDRTTVPSWSSTPGTSATSR